MCTTVQKWLNTIVKQKSNATRGAGIPVNVLIKNPPDPLYTVLIIDEFRVCNRNARDGQRLYTLPTRIITISLVCSLV